MKDLFSEDPESAEEPEQEALTPEIVEGPPAPLPAISPQPAQAAIIRVKTEIDLWIQEAKKITIIQDDVTNVRATEIATNLKRYSKAVTVQKEHYSRPHLDLIAAIRSFANQFLSPAEAEEKRLGRAQGDYRRYQENEKRKKQAALDKEAAELAARLEAEAEAAEKKGEVYTPVEMPAPVAEPVAKVVHTGSGSSSQKKVIRVEVVD
ncbi:MAG: hypothetical protein NTY64_04105, partial [Deltaproteobacteria bacterium]|nr:hypothetical protein [Deltaproteobacteria bacterium]